MFGEKKVKNALADLILELYVFNREDQCWDIKMSRSSIDKDTMKELIKRITQKRN